MTFVLSQSQTSKFLLRKWQIWLSKLTYNFFNKILRFPSYNINNCDFEQFFQKENQFLTIFFLILREVKLCWFFFQTLNLQCQNSGSNLSSVINFVKLWFFLSCLRLCCHDFANRVWDREKLKSLNKYFNYILNDN